MIPLYPWCHTSYNPYIGLVVIELFGTMSKKTEKHKENGFGKLQISNSIPIYVAPKHLCNSECNPLYSFWVEYAC